MNLLFFVLVPTLIVADLAPNKLPSANRNFPFLASERLGSDREILHNATGWDQPIAQDLLAAISTGSRKPIQLSIAKAISHGHWRLVSLLLIDHFEFARQEAALALQETRNRTVATRLLQGWEWLQVAVMGGDDDLEEHQRTVAIFEAALSQQTNVKLEANWSHERKRAVFAGAIAKMYPD